MKLEEKKAWLNRAFNDEKIIAADLQEIQKLNILMDTGFGIDYSKPNVQTSKRGGAAFEDKLINLADIKREYVDRVINQERIKNQIRAKIDTLDDNLEKAILKHRHIDFMEWPQIADEIHVSRRQCFRIYNEAVQKIDI